MRRLFASNRGDAEKFLVVILGAVFVFGGVFALWRWSAGARSKPPVLERASPPSAPRAKSSADRGEVRRARAAEPTAPPQLSPEQKAARIDKINRDYDEIRTKTAADYSAAAGAFPGGLNAFLRQLALLEREKRADLASFLSPSELEEIERRETTAGQLVQRLLGSSEATEEQRRAVFRLQRAYEDKFALTFDVAAPALLQRESARQAMQEQIHAVLGTPLFGLWLQGEASDYPQLVKFAATHGLLPDAPLHLWRARNEYTLKRLELHAENVARGLPEGQMRAAQAALLQQTEGRVLAIVGQGAMSAARAEVLGWLPRK